jgi:hypothetical protein
MDIFVEQLVERKPDSRDSLLRICVVFGITAFSGLFFMLAVAFAQIQFISLVALAAIPGAIWLGVQLFKGLFCEYEYILTGNPVIKELDIDKIKGRCKRNRMVTLDLNNAEAFDICSDEVKLEADVTVSAHDNTYTNMWYLLIRHDTHGRVVLLFNPDDDFVSKLNKTLPHRARNKNI